MYRAFVPNKAGPLVTLYEWHDGPTTLRDEYQVSIPPEAVGVPSVLEWAGPQDDPSAWGKVSRYVYGDQVVSAVVGDGLVLTYLAPDADWAKIQVCGTNYRTGRYSERAILCRQCSPKDCRCRIRVDCARKGPPGRETMIA